MTAELIFLGTGTPVPDPSRAGSGTAIVDDQRWLLFDCGRGVTQRALEAGLDLAQLEGVFITHHHSDHISDLPTLGITRWVGGTQAPLPVYTPEGPCSEFVRNCLDVYPDESFHGQADGSAGPRPEIATEEFQPTREPTPVYHSERWTVSAALVDHHPITNAVGYRVEVESKVVAISGDTAVGRGVTALADRADYLIHEALRSDVADPQLLTWNASSVSVGELADRASVGTVILTHLIPRALSETDEERFKVEARSGGYGGSVIVARDGLRLSI